MNKNQNTISRLPVFFWVLMALNFLITVLSLTYNLTREDRVVYVDAIKLIAKYKGMEAAKAELNFKSQQWQNNLDTLRKEMEQSISDYERDKKALTRREDQLMRELIGSKQQQYLSYQQTAKDQYENSDKEMSIAILNKVNDYIKRYGESNGYRIILAATNYGNIAYGDRSLDITDPVLIGLNNEYQVGK